jgi:hypothetical protein
MAPPPRLEMKSIEEYFHGLKEGDLRQGPNHFIAQWIGVIASSWAMFEFTIDMAIWRLADLHPHKGSCITSQLANVSRRLNAWASLVDQFKPNARQKKEINKFIELSNALSRKRNRIIHDPWFHKGSDQIGETVRVEVTAERVFKWYYVQTDHRDLFDLAI